MRAFAYWLMCLILIGVMACGPKNEKPTLPAEPTALSIEEWQELGHHDKYDPAILERLRMNDEKLMKSDRAWKKFMNEVVLPQMKKDIPPPAN